MATVTQTDAGVTVTLSTKERMTCMHGDFSLTPEQVVSVEHADDLWSYVRGMKEVGAGMTGVVALGTRLGSGYTDFCAVYKKRGGLVITTKDFKYARILISDPK